MPSLFWVAMSRVLTEEKEWWPIDSCCPQESSQTHFSREVVWTLNRGFPLLVRWPRNWPALLADRCPEHLLTLNVVLPCGALPWLLAAGILSAPPPFHHQLPCSSFSSLLKGGDKLEMNKTPQKHRCSHYLLLRPKT